jgi:hypothetical protein
MRNPEFLFRRLCVAVEEGEDLAVLIGALTIEEREAVIRLIEEAS